MLRMQSYDNHTQKVPLLLSVAAILAAAFLYQLYLLFRDPSTGQLFRALVAGALMVLPFPLRSSTLRVQDRVIRLEMRLRLKEVLPVAMHGQIAALTTRHLIALRFAGDDELPSLVNEIAANPAITGKEIKQRVKNWQADYLRA